MDKNRDIVKIQQALAAGKSFKDSGLPESMSSLWAEVGEEYKWFKGNDLQMEVVNEWPDWSSETLEGLMTPLPDDMLAEWNKNEEKGRVAKEQVSTLFSKADNERRFTLGPMYIPNRLDAHNEWTDPDELQKAVWDYIRKGDRRIRLQHNKDVVAGEALEVMAWPYEVEVPMVMKDASTQPVTFPANTVFLGVQWQPWAWELVKSDKLRGYSIGGRAQRLLVDLPEE